MKYNEDKTIEEIAEYVKNTYDEHYSEGNIQTLDFIAACGDVLPFCRANILKYASRYNKKGNARKDIFKIIHYAMLLLYFSEKEN